MILAFDIGTSFLKGAVVDLDGRVLTRAEVPVRTACVEGLERHECDANTWLSGMALVTAQLGLRERGRLRGIVVSSNGPTLVPVSADAEPLDFAMTWMDRRSGREAELIAEFSDSHVDASFYVPKALWILKNKPELYEKTRWFLPCAEFVTFFLTGNAFRIIPTDHFKEFFWNESAIAHVGLDPEKFPAFLEMGDPAGSVTPPAEETLGIPAGIPVFAGGPDYVMSILGTASVQPGRACDRAGTSEGINLCSSRAVKDTRLLCYPHVASGAYNVSAMLSTSGAALQWAADSFARHKGEVDSLAREVQEVSPGADRLLFLPFLGPERFRTWSPASRGAFLGLTLSHGRKEMMRAVVESTGYAVRWIFEVMESNGCEVADVRVAGGQSRIPFWCQLRADITGKKVMLPEQEDSELVGNACVGFTALGEFESAAEASERMARFQKSFLPDAARKRLYDGLYDAFKTACADLMPANKKLTEEI
jgi:xylulokinase